MSKKHKAKLRKLLKKISAMERRQDFADKVLTSLTLSGASAQADLNCEAASLLTKPFAPRPDQVIRIAEARAILRPMAQRLKIVA